MTERSRGRVREVGAVVGSLALFVGVVGLFVLVLRLAAGPGTGAPSLIPVSVFLSIAILDIATAVSTARRRRDGVSTGSYSTIGGFSLCLLLPCIGLLGAFNPPGAWIASPLALLVIGALCVLGQFWVVARLDRVGRPQTFA